MRRGLVVLAALAANVAVPRTAAAQPASQSPVETWALTRVTVIDPAVTV